MDFQDYFTNNLIKENNLSIIMPNYVLIDSSTKVFRGDILKYFDEENNQKGIGILIKKYPEYYLLKNFNTGKLWRVYKKDYTFYKKDNYDSDISDFFRNNVIINKII